MDIIETIINEEENKENSQDWRELMLRSFCKSPRKAIRPADEAGYYKGYSRHYNQKHWDNTIQMLNSVYETCNELADENEKLRARSNDDIFKEKNEEIKELQEEVSSFRIALLRSLSYKEITKILDEYYVHRVEHMDDVPAQHKLAYHIAETGLGPVRYFKCTCGKEFDLGDADRL